MSILANLPKIVLAIQKRFCILALMSKNPAAVALGKLGKGKKKTLSEEEINLRTERLKKAREVKLDRMIRTEDLKNRSK